MLVKELKESTKSGIVAWCPLPNNTGLFCVASTSKHLPSTLEIFDTTGEKADAIGYFELSLPATALAWGISTATRFGVIAVALLDSSIVIISPQAIISKTMENPVIVTLKAHSGKVVAMDFNPVSKTSILASGSINGEVFVFDLESFSSDTEIKPFKFDTSQVAPGFECFMCLKWNPTTEAYFATAFSGIVVLWSYAKRRKIAQFGNLSNHPASLDWSPVKGCATQIAVGVVTDTHGDAFQPRVEIWDFKNQKEKYVKHSTECFGGVRGIDWSPHHQNSMLVTGKWKHGTLLLGEDRSLCIPSNAVGCKWSTDGKMYSVCREESGVQIYSVEFIETVKKLVATINNGKILDILQRHARENSGTVACKHTSSSNADDPFEEIAEKSVIVKKLSSPVGEIDLWKMLDYIHKRHNPDGVISLADFLMEHQDDESSIRTFSEPYVISDSDYYDFLWYCAIHDKIDDAVKVSLAKDKLLEAMTFVAFSYEGHEIPSKLLGVCNYLTESLPKNPKLALIFKILRFDFDELMNSATSTNWKVILYWMVKRMGNRVCPLPTYSKFGVILESKGISNGAQTCYLLRGDSARLASLWITTDKVSPNSVRFITLLEKFAVARKVIGPENGCSPISDAVATVLREFFWNCNILGDEALIESTINELFRGTPNKVETRSSSTTISASIPNSTLAIIPEKQSSDPEKKLPAILLHPTRAAAVDLISTIYKRALESKFRSDKVVNMDMQIKELLRMLGRDEVPIQICEMLCIGGKLTLAGDYEKAYSTSVLMGRNHFNDTRKYLQGLRALLAAYKEITLNGH
jgi:WD40 repeat protein